MSQPTTGDRGDGFPSIIHGQPYPAAQGSADYSNFFSYGQDRSAYAQSGNYFPVKPTNPHMVAGMRPQVQVQTGQVNHLQDMNMMHQQPPVHGQFVAGVNYGRAADFNSQYQHMQNNQYFHVSGQQQHYQYFQNSQNFQINHVMHHNQFNTHTFQQIPQSVKCETPNQGLVNQYYNNSGNAYMLDAKQDVEDITAPESKSGKYDDSANSSPANDSNTSACNTSHEMDSSATECFANAAKVKHAYGTNTFPTAAAAGSASNSMVNRPRANSRCDSTRSEAAESTCSSLSTESSNELAHHHGHPFHPYANSYVNPYVNNHGFAGNQMQVAGHSQSDGDTNNNMSYQHNGGNYIRANTVINKADQNVVQSFHHVETAQQVQMMQRGQLQIMQAQYQYLHGHNMNGARPTMAMNHNMQVGGPSSNQNHAANVMPPSQGQNVGHNACNVPSYCAVGRPDPFAGHKPFPTPSRMPGGPPPQHVMRLPHIQSCPPQMMRMAPQPVHHSHCEQQFVPPTGAKFSLPPAIVVPFGWKRVNNNGQVVYISPSGVNLHNVPQIMEYLSQDGTCKCGLQCPLRIEPTFSFDPKVPHRAILPNELALNDTKLCNHRRKLALSFDVQKQVKKEDGRKKRKRKTKSEPVSEGEDASVIGQCPPTAHDVHTLSHVSPQTHHGQHVQQSWNTGVPMQNPSDTCKPTDCMHGSIGETPTGYSQPGMCYTNPHAACAPANFYPNNPNFTQRNQCPSQEQPSQVAAPVNQQYASNGHPSGYYQAPVCGAAASAADHNVAAGGQPPAAVAKSAPARKRKKPLGRGKKRRKIEHENPPQKPVSPTGYLAGAETGCLVDGPDFMEDPNGYLARQTALLNSTMLGGGAGQFSPQGAAAKCAAAPFAKLQPAAAAIGDTTVDKGAAGPANPPPTASAAVVPLPSNVALPARVSKGKTLAVSQSQSQSQCGGLRTSVADSSSNSCSTPRHTISGVSSDGTHVSDTKSAVTTVESSCASHSVTVTYTSSCTTVSTCRSDVIAVDSAVVAAGSTNVTTTANSPLSSFSTACGDRTAAAKPIARLRRSQLLESDDDANRPLIPGTFSASLSSTQSPLEMVQHIVSSIPVPASPEDPTPQMPSTTSSKASLTGQYRQLTADGAAQRVSQVMAAPHQQQQQLFNVTTPSGSLAGVMYNTAGVIRAAPTPLVVHGGGTSQQSSMASGMLVNSGGSGGRNVVVVTAPFNSKGLPSAPAVCSSVSRVGSVVGIQGVPQVQVQPSVGQVQPHQFQPHMQQIHPVQPVMQLVNTFATMQAAPVLIQNGANILQPAGILSNQGGVLCPNNIITSSGTTYVSQPILPATSIAVGGSPLKMVSPNSDHIVDQQQGQGAANRLTPVHQVSAPVTPFSTPGSSGSDTPSSSGSGGGGGGGGRRRKKRNAQTTPPMVHHPANIMPAIIMGGKPLQPPIVVNNAQMPQLSPYGAVTMPQVATPLGNRGNAINVVQMVSGSVVQQAPTIIVPSAAPTGFIINQLSDGSFVSTDPNTGMSYPVQIQLSGSQIVGVSPVMTVNAVRGPHHHAAATDDQKVVNFSPATATTAGGINVFNVPTQISPTAATSTSTQYVAASEQTNPAGGATVVQQKTTIVAQQTTLVATQGGQLPAAGTHSSVSTQTPGALGESDVTSSDNVAVEQLVTSREASTSPSHQSAEITTTRHDSDTITPSPPDCQPCTPPIKPVPTSDAKFAHNTQQHSDGPTISVVYGQHRGHSKWPGQVLNQAGGRVIIQWFGDRMVESVTSSNMSKSPPCISTITRSRFREKNFLLTALSEADTLAGRLTVYSPAVLSNPRIPDVNRNQIATQAVKAKRKRKAR